MIVLDILLDGLFAAIAGIGFGAISDPPMRAFPYIALLAAVGHACRFCLMTFFGVNYYLSGLHSYGKSEGFSPEIVLAAGAGVLVLVAVAAVRYHKNKKTS